MTITSNKIYEQGFPEIKESHFAKAHIVDQLLLKIENIDDISVRCDCLKALEHIDFVSDELFYNLENLLVSDSEDEIRRRAAIIIGKKFHSQSLDPLVFAILHERKYVNVLTVLIILEKLKVKEIHAILIKKLKVFSGLDFDVLKSYPSNQLIEILINQLTLSCLRRKFSNLEYKQENGHITELDFSKVDNKILDWRYREMIQEHSEIHGIRHLKQLKRVIPFSIQWAIKNDFTMHCQVELLKTMAILRNDWIKNSLINQIECFDDPSFKTSISQLFDIRTNLSTSELIDVYLNFLVIAFLKKKAPTLSFRLKSGMVNTLNIENTKLIKIPVFIQLLTNLESLRLHRCSIYELPEFIGKLKNLKNLDLSYNKINIISVSMMENKSLKNINLMNNQISSSAPILLNL